MDQQPKVVRRGAVRWTREWITMGADHALAGWYEYSSGSCFVLSGRVLLFVGEDKVRSLLQSQARGTFPLVGLLVLVE